MLTQPTYTQLEPVKKPSKAFGVVTLLVLLVLAMGASPSSAAFFHSTSSSGSGDASRMLQGVLTLPAGIKKIFSPSVAPTSTVQQVIRVVSEESQVIDVVKNSSDAVVSIIASSEVPKMTQCAQQAPIQGLPLGLQGMLNIPSLCQNGTELKQVGAGSGFIASPDGYIITNKHVVSDEKGEYTVIMNDQKHLGQKLKATVVARSPEQDIAILKVSAGDLPFLGLGDSSHLQVGQTAIAIGYALGEFDNTVSKGVVSGLYRSISAGDGASSEDLRGLIQTDAAINPGNSGGPLLDIGGNVIGMNTAIANSAQSIGFAIPVNDIKNAFNQARTTGKIVAQEHAFLGVRYLQVGPEVQAANHLAYDYGVLVGHGKNASDVAVVPNSPAAKAGIEENDLILEADGRQLNERNQLFDVVASHKPGDTMTLKIFHKGETKIVTVTLEKKP